VTSLDNGTTFELELDGGFLAVGGVDWTDETSLLEGLEGAELSAEAAHLLSEHLPPPRPAEQLHEMCDAEMVPDSGQRQWASTLRQFGGEYDAIAQLAHAHEAQCLQIMGQDHIVGDEDEWDDD